MWIEYFKSYQNPEEAKQYIELGKKSKEVLLKNLEQEKNEEKQEEVKEDKS